MHFYQLARFANLFYVNFGENKLKNSMIKKTIVVLACIAVATQIKSQDALVGKKIFQGNLNLNVANIKTSQENSNTTGTSIPFINSDKTFSIGTYGLFGKIDGSKNVFSVGFNVNVVQQKKYNYKLNEDTSYRYKALKLMVGPTFGSAKFIAISENFYLAPATTFNIYGIVEKNEAKYPSGQVIQEENKNGIGAGASLNIVPLRIAYLWKENILLTTSIGSIGGIFEYQNSKGEASSTYFNSFTNSYVTNTIKLKESKFNANIIGGISNFASFGVSYLFK
jgi:hypothetical protein